MPICLWLLVQLSKIDCGRVGVHVCELLLHYKIWRESGTMILEPHEPTGARRRHIASPRSLCQN